MDDLSKDQSMESKLQRLQTRFDALEAIVLAKEKEDSVLNRFVDSVNVIGLREAVISKKPHLKFIWAFLFLGGVAMTVYFMYQTIVEYMANPTLTKVRLDTDSHYQYPALVLCNNAWLNGSQANGLGLSPDGFRYSMGYMDIGYLTVQTLGNASEARSNFTHVFKENNFQSLADFYMDLAVHLQQTLSKDEFYYITSPAYFVEGDSFEDAHLVFGPTGAICHAFHFKPVHGKIGSLVKPVVARLKYGTEDESSQWLLNLFEGSSARYSLPLTIPASARSNLRIQAETFISLRTPQRPCVENQEGYSSSNCMTDCQNDFHKEKFGCSLFYMVSAQRKQKVPHEFCNFYDIVDSTEHLHNEAQSTQARDYCFNKCPRPCKRPLFEATIQGTDRTYDWFHGEEENKILSNQNMSLTTLSVLHDAIRQDGIVTFTEVGSYSFVAFASNVGGTLGLFIGGALMTFAQLLLFIVGYFGQKNGKKIEDKSSKK